MPYVTGLGPAWTISSDSTPDTVLFWTYIQLSYAFIAIAVALAVMFYLLAVGSALASLVGAYRITFKDHTPTNPELLAVPIGVVATIVTLRAAVPFVAAQSSLGELFSRRNIP